MLTDKIVTKSTTRGLCLALALLVTVRLLQTNIYRANV